MWQVDMLQSGNCDVLSVKISDFECNVCGCMGVCHENIWEAGNAPVLPSMHYRKIWQFGKYFVLLEMVFLLLTLLFVALKKKNCCITILTR